MCAMRDGDEGGRARPRPRLARAASAGGDVNSVKSRVITMIYVVYVWRVGRVRSFKLINIHLFLLTSDSTLI